MNCDAVFVGDEEFRRLRGRWMGVGCRDCLSVQTRDPDSLGRLDTTLLYRLGCLLRHV